MVYTRAMFTAIILLASVLGAFFLVLPSAADTVSNDDFSTAETISPGTHNGALDGVSDYEDYYQFGITSGVDITVDLTSDSNDLVMTLYDEDETWLAEVDGTPSVTESLYYQTASETEYVTCYLVLETQESAVSYSFTVTLTPQNDGGSGGDAPAEMSEAFIVVEGAIVGEVNSGSEDNNDQGEDDKDWYKFYAGMGDRINISFTSAAFDFLYLSMIDDQDDFIFQDLRVRLEGTVTEEWWTANETAMGWYYLEVDQDMAPGHYTITLDIERQNEAASGGDAPADPAIGVLTSPGNINGHLEDDDKVDCYRVYMGWGDVINIAFSGYSEGDNIYFELLDNTGSTLVSNKSSASDSGFSVSYYTANETSLRFFWMKVRMDSEPGDYVLSYTVERQNDAGKNMDVPKDSATQAVLGTGSYEGWIFDLDTVDMYLINLSSGDVLDITFGISDGISAMIELMNSSLSAITSRTANFGTFARIRYCLDTIIENETVYVKISSGSARYSLGISISGQNDANLGGDAGGVTEMGIPSTSPYTIGAGTFSGYLFPNDYTDSYTIQVPSDNELNISVVPEATLTVGGTLFNSTDAIVDSEVGSTSGAGIVLKYEFTEAESVQLVIGSYGTWGNYTLTVVLTELAPSQNTPSAPTLSATPGPGKVTLTWTAPASDGGSAILGYNIYKKMSGTLTPATLLTMVGPTTLTYTDAYVVVGTTYEYYR